MTTGIFFYESVTERADRFLNLFERLVVVLEGKKEEEPEEDSPFLAYTEKKPDPSWEQFSSEVPPEEAMDKKEPPVGPKYLSGGTDANK